LWRHRWRHHYKSCRNWKSCIWSYGTVIFLTIWPRGGFLEQFEKFSCHGSKSPPRGRIISKFLLYLVKIFIFSEKLSKGMIHTYESWKNNFSRKIGALFLRIGFFACYMGLNAYSYESLMHFDLQYCLPKDLGPKRAVTDDFRFQRFENPEPFLFFKVEIYKQFYFKKIQIQTKSISFYNLTRKNKNGS